MKKINKIALITSGGDVPGLNACIRAIVKACSFYEIDCYGFEDGYDGFIENRFNKLEPVDVTNIIHQGGTILRSSRSKRFMTPEGRKTAFENFKNNGFEVLIIIGGDGSLTGAAKLSEEFEIPIIGIPKTIDNDVSGTDYAIGFDTAINFATQAIDRIKDTAKSHNRLYLVEVMGRKAGYIAWQAGLATGAEGILIPETDNDLTLLYESLELKKDWKNRSWIVVVAEGDEHGGAYDLQKIIKDKFPKLEIGVTVLGHTLRGGSPTCFDRNLATSFGIEAILAIQNNIFNVMIGQTNTKISHTPLNQVKNRNLPFGDEQINYLKILSK